MGKGGQKRTRMEGSEREKEFEGGKGKLKEGDIERCWKMIEEEETDEWRKERKRKEDKRREIKERLKRKKGLRD